MCGVRSTAGRRGRAPAASPPPWPRRAPAAPHEACRHPRQLTVQQPAPQATLQPAPQPAQRCPALWRQWARWVGAMAWRHVPPTRWNRRRRAACDAMRGWSSARAANPVRATAGTIASCACRRTRCSGKFDVVVEGVDTGALARGIGTRTRRGAWRSPPRASFAQLQTRCSGEVCSCVATTNVQQHGRLAARG